VIFRRLLLAAVALALFSAGAAVFVVAASFGAYALFEPRLGRAGAAGALAALIATLIVVSGLFMAWAGRKRPSKSPQGLAGGLFERALAFVKQKPILAASAAIGAGFMATRDPKYLGTVLRAFLDGETPSK